MKFILILILSVFVYSCTKEETAQITFEDKMKSKCGNYIKERLKDPDSYQSKGWVIKKIPYEDYLKTKKKYPDYDYKFYDMLYINEYRGKNSFGAYTGNDLAYFLVDSTGQFEFCENGSLPTYFRINE